MYETAIRIYMTFSITLSLIFVVIATMHRMKKSYIESKSGETGDYTIALIALWCVIIPCILWDTPFPDLPYI